MVDSGGTVRRSPECPSQEKARRSGLKGCERYRQGYRAGAILSIATLGGAGASAKKRRVRSELCRENAVTVCPVSYFGRTKRAASFRQRLEGGIQRTARRYRGR